LERFGLLVFLVAIVPLGIYWAGHGFESPEAGLSRFAGEVGALHGVPRPEPETPAPEPEPAVDRVIPEPPKTPEAPRSPDAPTEDRRTKAARLFHEGNFLGAAQAAKGIDESRHALARLGVALEAAFPIDLPDAPWLRVETTAGGSFEGFAEERGDQLRITSATGRSLSLPTNVVSSRVEVPREKALAGAARRIRAEGGTESSGPKLFALIGEALRIGHPEAAALAACMLEPEESALSNRPLVRSPTRLGNGVRNNGNRSLQGRSALRDAQALALMKKAGPLREKADQLWKKTRDAGLKGADIDEIDEAIGLLERALEFYEKALEHEDADEIHALLRHSSKRAFQLRMWRDQVAGR
jgi:hypothetical protein